MIRIVSKILVFLALVFGGVGKANTNSYRGKNMTETYEIYPLPQNIEYEEETLTITKNVNLITMGEIDEATVNKAYDVISLKPVLTKKTDTVSDVNTNVILAVYGSNYSSLINDDVSYIPDKIDAYYLEINNKNIVVVGKDTDAVFYGLASLQFIFEQTNNVVRTLKIKDYSQSALRGFIEGYYGIPWTAEERKELMRFGSRVKTNIYIYAPKDDVYHSTSWRSLYSKYDYKVLKDQVQAGIESKTRLAWAIHPFMNKPLKRATFADDLHIIKEKFEQVYAAGVRQFVVSADDVNMFAPGREAEQIEDVPHHAVLHRDLLNELSQWVKSKGDCYQLVFVPTCYNNTDDHCALYYQYLMPGLDESIQIMWTGQKVCSSMNNMAYQAFHNYSQSEKKPFIWMNWPVNDYAINYLLLGEGEVLNEQYQEDDDVEFAGLVVNPLQLAEASKMSIWACGDYAWNSKSFDMHKSYLDSLKYIEDEETEAFRQVAEHLTNASQFEDGYFKEAESLKPLIENFKEAEDKTQATDDLLAYFDNLVKACENFLDNASNRKLVVNIEPWVKAEKYTALAAMWYLKTAKEFAEHPDPSIRTSYDKAMGYREASLSQVAPNLIGAHYAIEDRPAYACKTVLTPFVEYLEDNFIDEISIYLGEDTGVKTKGMGSVYRGQIGNMFDGNLETFCWFGDSSQTDDYIRIDLVTLTELRDIEVIFGNEDPNSLDRMTGVIEVSNNAKDWTTVGSFTSNYNVADLRNDPVSTRFIRLRCTQDDTHWVSIREIQWNKLSSDIPTITYSGLGDIDTGTPIFMSDNDLSTYCLFNTPPQVGGYILFDYHEVKEINDLLITFGTGVEKGLNDRFRGLLQYSLDGENWTTLYQMESLTVQLDLRSSPISLRYLRMFADHETTGWTAVRDVQFNVLTPDTPLVTYSGFNGIDEGTPLDMIDNDLSTYCWFNSAPAVDGYILVDYLDTKEVNDLKITFGTGKSVGENDRFKGRLQYSLNGTDWTDLGKMDDLVYQLDFRSSPLTLRYLRMFANEETSGWVAVREIELNVLDDNTPIVTYSNIGNIYKGALLNIVDNDDDSFCFFDTNVTVGSYIQIDYLTYNIVKGINILFGTGVTEGLNDKFVGELQYSLDGENWTKIADMNDLEIHIDLTSDPLSFRYLRMYAPNYQPGWVAVRTVALVIDN